MKIGLFDSGIGGIAVLRKLIGRFPDFDYVYLADTKRAPFGTKDRERLVDIVEEDLEILKRLGSNVVVAACNTADSIVSRMNINMPYISIIESGVEMVEGNRIGVLATDATVKLGSYAERLREKDIVQRSLQELVSIVENGMEEDIMRSYLKETLDEEILRCDEVILGCTHFSLVADIFRELLPKVIDPVEKIVDKLEIYKSSGSGKIEIYTTSDVLTFKEKVEKFGILKGTNPVYRKVEIREEYDSHIGLVRSW